MSGCLQPGFSFNPARCVCCRRGARGASDACGLLLALRRLRERSSGGEGGNPLAAREGEVLEQFGAEVGFRV